MSFQSPSGITIPILLWENRAGTNKMILSTQISALGVTPGQESKMGIPELEELCQCLPLEKVTQLDQELPGNPWQVWFPLPLLRTQALLTACAQMFTGPRAGHIWDPGADTLWSCLASKANGNSTRAHPSGPTPMNSTLYGARVC